MTYTLDKQKIYNSDHLFKLLKDQQFKESDDVLNELVPKFHSLKREVVNFSSFFGSINNYYLFLIDEKGVRRYKIAATSSIHFQIDRCFDTMNKRDNQEIIELTPLNSAHLKNHHSRIYYETNDKTYELRLWTIIADRMRSDLVKWGWFNNGLNLYFTENGAHHKDECYFSSSSENMPLHRWSFNDFSNTLQNNLISFKGTAEINLYREYYANFYYTGQLNIYNGDLIIQRADFDHYNYK